MPVSYYPNHDGAFAIQQRGESRSEALHLTGLTPHASFVLERMALEDTATYVWEQMGRPVNLTRAQVTALKNTLPRREMLHADEQGELTLSLTLSPWEIVCLYQVD